MVGKVWEEGQETSTITPARKKRATQEPSVAFFTPQFTLESERRNMITNRNLSISASGLGASFTGFYCSPLVPGLHPTLSEIHHGHTLPPAVH